ncbi:MAG: thiamine pyrophosphate-dependent enzyme [Dehalococcoidia bacterium]|nr:thiamine pyrophosphate-dependent enzyme [Dehalococcoidia bacterium]
MVETQEKIWVSGSPRLWFRHKSGARQCPGCHHPITERLIAEVVDEMGLENDIVLVTGIGCTSRAAGMFKFDAVLSAHGRPPDVATAIKRTLDGEPIVLTLQGDGDCISIGAGPFFNAVARAEKITVIMANNGNYGTTGGQMAPTTLLGQVTSTTPEGRTPHFGYPMHVPEMIAPLKGVAYAARGSVHTPANYQRTKKYLKTALQKQIDKVGFSFLEILSACPPDWHLNPVDSLKWIEDRMIPEFPLGEFKNVDKIE